MFGVLLQPQNQSVVGSWLNQRDQGPDGYVSPRWKSSPPPAMQSSRGRCALIWSLRWGCRFTDLLRPCVLSGAPTAARPCLEESGTVRSGESFSRCQE